MQRPGAGSRLNAPRPTNGPVLRPPSAAPTDEARGRHADSMTVFTASAVLLDDRFVDFKEQFIVDRQQHVGSCVEAVLRQCRGHANHGAFQHVRGGALDRGV